MTSTARLKQFSPIWHLWRNTNRIGGGIHGVIFRWEAGKIYRSDLLLPEQAALLATHASIEVEAVGEAPSQPRPAGDALTPQAAMDEAEDAAGVTETVEPPAAPFAVAEAASAASVAVRGVPPAALKPSSPLQGLARPWCHQGVNPGSRNTAAAAGGAILTAGASSTKSQARVDVPGKEAPELNIQPKVSAIFKPSPSSAVRPYSGITVSLTYFLRAAALMI
jgi:hypothetical protein